MERMAELGPESPPARGAWIEILLGWLAHIKTASPPARGAWIEIAPLNNVNAGANVAPRTGGVD